jgi:hypothetical protein
LRKPKATIGTGRRYTFGKVEQCPSWGNLRVVTLHLWDLGCQEKSGNTVGVIPETGIGRGALRSLRDLRTGLSAEWKKSIFLFLSGFLLVAGTLVVEGEEAFEDFGVGEVGGPSVGGEDGLVEFAVGVVEPRRALVV